MIECNLLEHDIEEIAQSAEVNLTLKPFEIKTIKLYL